MFSRVTWVVITFSVCVISLKVSPAAFFVSFVCTVAYQLVVVVSVWFVVISFFSAFGFSFWCLLSASFVSYCGEAWIHHAHLRHYMFDWWYWCMSLLLLQEREGMKAVISPISMNFCLLVKILYDRIKVCYYGDNYKGTKAVWHAQRYKSTDRKHLLKLIELLALQISQQ